MSSVFISDATYFPLINTLPFRIVLALTITAPQRRPTTLSVKQVEDAVVDWLGTRAALVERGAPELASPVVVQPGMMIRKRGKDAMKEPVAILSGDVSTKTVGNSDYSADFVFSLARFLYESLGDGAGARAYSIELGERTFVLASE